MDALASGPSKVVAGYFSFTEITDPTAHRAYNEWHQLDHLPEQHTLDGIVHGERWVCTAACREVARAVEPLDRIHYLTLYLLADPLERTIDDFFALARRLRADGRFFEARRSHLSGAFAVADTWAAPRVHVSAAAVPFRPNRGVYVVVEAARDDAVPAGRVGATLAGIDGVAGVWRFAGPVDAHGDPGNASTITVAFLDRDPLLVARAADIALDGSLARSMFSGPLLAVTPGDWDWFEAPGPADPSHQR